MKKGPKSVTWYICGRDFGTTSYGIHYTQCQKKFEEEQKQNDKADRRKIPDPPTGIDDILSKKKLTDQELEEFNSQAFDIYNKQSLEKCEGCGRTFKPESLIVHQKSWKGVKEGKSSGGMTGSSMGSSLAPAASKKKTSSKSPSRGPKSLTWYIWGKGFMKGSISIHLTQCADKFKKESENLGVKRKLPPQPEELAELLEMETLDEDLLAQYNEKASRAYNEVGLMKCPNCSRTFNPDSLKVHMKSWNTKYGTDADPFASTKKKQGRPQGIMCYIWGKEYFAKSLEIHVKSCKETWIREENLKPKNKRRPLPEPPKNFEDIICGKITTEDREEYNDQAFKEYNEKALEPCEFCGRTFLPDRLVVHLKSCGKGKTKSSPVRGGAKAPKGEEDIEEAKVKPSAITKTAPKASPSGPPGLICYIWGRKYGTKSLDIHLKQCIELWEKTEAQKPPGERRPVPTAPKNFDEMKIGGAGSKAMDEYNDEAFKNYNEKALVPWDIWGRTFLPDRLVVHQRSWKPKKVDNEEGKIESKKSPVKKVGAKK